MTEIVNLDDCKLSLKNGFYGGAAGSKDGIIYQGENWLVKYPKNIMGLERTGEASYSTSPLSEYIGSHIYEILGYDVHETILGERHNKIVVACKDFANDAALMEIRTIKNHTSEELDELLEQRVGDSTGSEHIVDLEELLIHLKNNSILKDVQGIEERFWEQAVIDIFINNNDRNNGNWGILRTNDGIDKIAPVFDNGGSFQTKISEEKIEKTLSDLELARKNASNTQTAYGVRGHILSAVRFLELHDKYEGLQQAIIKVVPLIHSRMSRIQEFIMQIPEKYNGKDDKEHLICSTKRKLLFMIQLQARLEDLLLPYYEKALKLGMPKIDEPSQHELNQGMTRPKRGR